MNTMNKFLLGLARLSVLLAVPYLLLVGSARLIMNPALLTFEYTRAGFPVDFYGFSIQDRLQYGKYGIEYILSDASIAYLGDLQLDGALCYPPQTTPCPMFNERELEHMEDVKLVAQGLFTGLWLVIGMLAVSSIGLWRTGHSSALLQALMQGGYATLGMLALIIFVAVFAWDNFFSGFHALFFEADSWRFYYSDSLIRLYPEQFWFDASLTIGGLSVLGALVLLVVLWRYQRPSVG